MNDLFFPKYDQTRYDWMIMTPFETHFGHFKGSFAIIGTFINAFRKILFKCELLEKLDEILREIFIAFQIFDK